jgi:hypothetical protein
MHEVLPRIEPHLSTGQPLGNRYALRIASAGIRIKRRGNTRALKQVRIEAQLPFTIEPRHDLPGWNAIDAQGDTMAPSSKACGSAKIFGDIRIHSPGLQHRAVKFSGCLCRGLGPGNRHQDQAAAKPPKDTQAHYCRLKRAS